MKKVLPLARQLQKKAGDSNRRSYRTKALKRVLRREAHNLPRKIRVFPDTDGRLKERQSEWLLDLVWWNDEPGRKGVELAVESEWNAAVNDVVYDFEKLLGIKSPLKLMLYRTTPKTRAAVQSKIEEYLSQFRHHVKGENYVICEYESGAWRCYLYKIECDGCLTAPKRLKL